MSGSRFLLVFYHFMQYPAYTAKNVVYRYLEKLFLNKVSGKLYKYKEALVMLLAKNDCLCDALLLAILFALLFLTEYYYCW